LLRGQDERCISRLLVCTPDLLLFLDPVWALWQFPSMEEKQLEGYDDNFAQNLLRIDSGASMRISNVMELLVDRGKQSLITLGISQTTEKKKFAQKPTHVAPSQIYIELLFYDFAARNSFIGFIGPYLKLRPAAPMC